MPITLYQNYVPATGDAVTGNVTLTPVVALPVGTASLARVTRTVPLVAGAFSVTLASVGPYSIRENLTNGVSKGFSGTIVVPDVGEEGYRSDTSYKLHDLIAAQAEYEPPVVSSAIAAKNAAEAARDDAQDIVDDFAVGVVPDAGVAARVATAASATQAAVDARVTAVGNATYASLANLPYVPVDEFKLPGDSDDTASWQRAITFAVANNVRKVLGRKSDYYLSGRLNCAGSNRLSISAQGEDVTTMWVNGASLPVESLFYSTGNVTDLVIENMNIRGTAVDDVTGPRRSRTFTGPGLTAAAIFQGDARPGTTGRPVIKNVKLRNVKIYGTRALPWLFDGVRGRSQIMNVETENTMDGGFIYCDHVIWDKFTSINSADNGLSVSRGCKRVTGGTTDVQNCAYFGLWVSGYIADPANLDPTWIGPTDFSIDTVNVVNAGKGGVQLDDAPMNGRIGNIYVRGALRGPSDEPSDISGLGVRVGGYPSSARATPTIYAKAIKIDNILLIDCARGGVAVSGCTDINIRSGMIVNAGTQYKADGTTVIAATDYTQNFGIAAEAGAEATVTRLSLGDIRVIDNRGTPFTNYPTYLTGTVSSDYADVSSYGTRQLVNSDNRDVSYAGTKTFGGNTKYPLGATSGTNAATGTVPGFDANGASASTRMFAVLTAGVKRWMFGGNADSESSSGVGSNFEILSRNDDGTARKTILRIMRSTGVLNFLSAFAENRVGQTLAADGAVAIDASAGNVQAVSLSANATSSSITNPTTGQRITIIWSQDVTGGRTYAWPSNCKFAGGAAPTASTTAAYRDAVTFSYDGTNWIETSRSIAVR